MYAIDMLKMYIGVEHYYEYDDEGNYLESKCISIYYLNSEFKTNSNSRKVLINLETADTIHIDNNGYVIKYESDDREIMDITYLHSFRDSVNELIKTTKDFIGNMEYGKESLEYFILLKNHMDEMFLDNKPAFLDADALDDLVEMLPNIYTLSYGNPLTNESKIKCLYNFKRGGKK